MLGRGELSLAVRPSVHLHPAVNRVGRAHVGLPHSPIGSHSAGPGGTHRRAGWGRGTASPQPPQPPLLSGGTPPTAAPAPARVQPGAQRSGERGCWSPWCWRPVERPGGPGGSAPDLRLSRQCMYSLPSFVRVKQHGRSRERHGEAFGKAFCCWRHQAPSPGRAAGALPSARALPSAQTQRQGWTGMHGAAWCPVNMRGEAGAARG